MRLPLPKRLDKVVSIKKTKYVFRKTAKTIRKKKFRFESLLQRVQKLSPKNKAAGTLQKKLLTIPVLVCDEC